MASEIIHFGVFVNRLRWDQLVFNFKSFINLEVIINALGKLPVHFLNMFAWISSCSKTVIFYLSLCEFKMTATCCFIYSFAKQTFMFVEIQDANFLFQKYLEE